MESWDDDNFEPAAPAVVPVPTNKWEGEDEDDEVKESWEDDDEEKKQDVKVDEDVKKPKKKTLAEKIAEKERLKREEMEKRMREQEEEEEISPEEMLRRQKESDLKLALETTFDYAKPSGFDDLTLPDTKEEFETFTDVLSKKLTPLSKSVEYPTFVENLTRNLCATMSSLDIRKIKNSLDNLYLEKQKIEKGDKSKKSKGKGKARLKMEGDNQLSQLSAYVNDYDDYDDFM